MKLDFFKLFGAQASSLADIAQQIVKLEDAMPSFKKAVENAEAECAKARKAKLIGGAYSQSEFEDKWKQLEEARIDLMAAEQTLPELNEKLKKTVEESARKEIEAIDTEEAQLRTEYQKVRRAMIKAAAELQAVVMASGELAIVNFGDLVIRTALTFEQAQQESQIFNDELNRICSDQKELPHPTCLEKVLALRERRAAATESAGDRIRGLLAAARQG